VALAGAPVAERRRRAGPGQGGPPRRPPRARDR